MDGLISDRRDLHTPAPPGAPEPQLAHQALGRASGDLKTFTIKLYPDLTGTVDLEIFIPDALDFITQPSITTDT